MTLTSALLDRWQGGTLLKSSLGLVAPRLVRRLARPTLAELVSCGEAIRTSPHDVLDRLLGAGWRDSGFEREFREIDADLVQRCQAAGVPPHGIRIGPLTGLALYVWVRTRRPTTVLETGVMHGCSTAILLNALRRNGHGCLHSTDLLGDAGGLLTEQERAAWHFHALARGAPGRAFAALVARLGSIDLFLHDSLHSYHWQRLEYETVRTKIPAGGLLASDNVDASYAFAELCRETGRTAALLLDGYKLSGFIPWT